MVVDGTQNGTNMPCWRTLLAMQRVSAGVAKALLLCIVTASPARGASAAEAGVCASDIGVQATNMPEQPEDELSWAPSDASDALQASRLQVEVIEVSRWAPELNRHA